MKQNVFCTYHFKSFSSTAGRIGLFRKKFYEFLSTTKTAWFQLDKSVPAIKQNRKRYHVYIQILLSSHPNEISSFILLVEEISTTAIAKYAHVATTTTTIIPNSRNAKWNFQPSRWWQYRTLRSYTISLRSEFEITNMRIYTCFEGTPVNQ